MYLDQERKKHVLGAILAGGSSSRMGGQDKFLLPLNGKRILDHIIERFEPQVSSLILNLNGDKNRVNNCSLDIIPDIHEPHCGPLGGLFTALSYARERNFSWVVTVSCDTPFIPNDYVSRLFDHPSKNMVIAKSFGRLHPTMGLWNINLLDDLALWLKDNEFKMSKWIGKHSAGEVSWEMRPDPFLNINCLEDLLLAEKDNSKSQL